VTIYIYTYIHNIYIYTHTHTHSDIGRDNDIPGEERGLLFVMCNLGFPHLDVLCVETVRTYRYKCECVVNRKVDPEFRVHTG
jgi:hypothetical protein